MSNSILMTHIVAGYPNVLDSIKITELLIKSSKYIEIQMPFTDPMADGNLILEANHQALKSIYNLNQYFDFISTLYSKNKEIENRLIYVGYYNNIFSFGQELFIQKLKEFKFKGCLIPDLPVHESINQGFEKICKKYNIENIKILSPIMAIDRLKENLNFSSSLCYITAKLGVTGNTNQNHLRLEQFLSEIKKIKPSIEKCVGFGIRNYEDIINIRKIGADLAVIGSQLIVEYTNNSLEGLEKFLLNITENKNLI